MAIAGVETRVHRHGEGVGHNERVSDAFMQVGSNGTFPGRRNSCRLEGWDFAGNSVDNEPRWGKPGETMSGAILGSSPM